ncbi:MAG: DUF3078 domain-containing protein [Bacteroidia bacterium]|nr:DUF3078 domain-containing protein [Bacteroidia bacterium]
MRSICFALIISVLSFSAVQAQTETKKDTSWKSGAVISLNLTQVSLTNWAGGGANSISGVALFNGFENYKKGKHAWDNNITLAYGIVKNGDADAIKNEDRIELNSKYGYELSWEHWYGSAFLNFRSQFDKGFANPGDEMKISDFLAPAYVTTGLGLDYKPSDNFSVLIAPVTLKMTIVNDDILAAQGAFGVEAGVLDTSGTVILKDGEKLRTEFGGLINALYKVQLMENIKFSTGITLFSNYSEDPDHIDVNWETLIAATVNKYITVTFGTQLIYDHDIIIQEFKGDGTPKLNANGNPVKGPRTQFKSVLGLGFTYAF